MLELCDRGATSLRARVALRARSLRVDPEDDDAGARVGGGQVAVQDLLDPERRRRDVHALLDLQRELARGDLVDAAAADDQALARRRACCAASTKRARWASVSSITRVQVAASAAPAIAVKASSGET